MDRNFMRNAISLILMTLLVVACGPKSELTPETQTKMLTSTSEILLTSASGSKLAVQENVKFNIGQAKGVVLQVFPDSVKQTIDGIGTSFTESSAFVLAHLEPQDRMEVMQKIYGEEGANFSLTRTHIGACDFSVEGKYSYAEKAGDTELESFSIQADSEGFAAADYPGIKDTTYDLLPMIQEALKIKQSQEDSELRIIASAWTAPAWMKENEMYYEPGTPENNWQGTGGSLKPEYVSTYADYLVRYFDAYKAAGVNIWGLTPVNEPHGNNGQWESMNFSPETQSEFVQTHLGPGLRKAGYGDARLLIFDQNRDGIEEWSEVLYPADVDEKYIYGMAVHWYESTFKVYEDIFDRVHDKYPQYSIVHTEGCIDDLGKPAPADCTDPEGRTEKNWFKNDSFWWTQSASDWGYAVPWTPGNGVDHPLYTPVHRYARNIIVSLDHWVTGWVDWNIVLDQQGGPNHAGNFCGAPIMIDTESLDVYYTPIYSVLAQFSRTIRPGDKALQTHASKAGLNSDDIHFCATINEAGLMSVQVLNTSAAPIQYKLQIAGEFANLSIAENSVQTVRVQL
ncbi:MAG: glycosyl hydrolase [Candidatus Marinimicrobia bacterium]|nr:glycosyl hydrolase [Candidatus Neomarinimicrobiota bacterium]